MKPLFSVYGLVLNNRVLRRRSFQRCFCSVSNNDNAGDNKTKQDSSQLEKLLDEAAQGLGPLDEAGEEDEWRTSPYTRGAIINSRCSHSSKSLRPNVDPMDTSIILFPGYGSQYVGMGRELMRFPAARDIFEASCEILKFDVLKLMLNGPKWKLNEINYADPLIFISSLAALEKLKEERPWAIENCVATAGFSVGEITALTFSGVFKFSDALKLVKTRAEAIQVTADMESGGMAMVHYHAGSKLKEAILKSKEWCLDRGINDPECAIAAYLNPNMKIIAGHTEALRYLDCNKAFYKLNGLNKLPMKGAYHTKLMMPVAEAVRHKLKKLEAMEPAISVHSSVNGHYYTDPQHVYKILPKQIYTSIKWEQIIQILYERDAESSFPETIICGPTNQLREYLRQALTYMKSHLKEFKLARLLPVKASAAMHTNLMKPAADIFKQFLNTIELSEPSAYVYSNLTGKRYATLDSVQRGLPKQIRMPILWEQLVHKVFDREPEINMPSVFTCGPRSPELKQTLVRVNYQAARKCVFVF